jgi:hypothetical protein
MLVTYIRSSSYNNYDFCQQQYFINYVLGHPTKSGKKAEMGTIVHKVMECLARAKLCVQDGKKSFKDDAFGRIRINAGKLFSKTFLSSMVDKSYEHYTSKSHHEFQKRDYNDCKKWVDAAIEYNDGQFDPRNRKIICPEQQFDIEIKEPWAEYSYELPSGEKVSGNLAIKGTIDLITEADDGIIEVIDWKTGRRLDWATGKEKNYEHLSKDPQLLMYFYAISCIFKQYEQSIMTIFYIRDGGAFSFCFDQDSCDYFLGLLEKRFKEIKENQDPVLLSSDRSHWKCTKLCDYYKTNWKGTNKSMCKFVGDKIKKDGIENTIKECTREDFNIGFYEAPG